MISQGILATDSRMSNSICYSRAPSAQCAPQIDRIERYISCDQYYRLGLHLSLSKSLSGHISKRNER